MLTAWNLLRHELLTEWREKNALSSIILYVLSSTFVIYQIFKSTDPKSWIALYWIIMIFASINAASRTFIQSESKTKGYFFFLASDRQVLLSKLIFNFLLLLLLAIVSNLSFQLFLGQPLNGYGMWLTISLLGVFGFASTFTVIAAIGAKASNAAVLTTILGLPLVIPQVLILVRLSEKCIQLLPGADFNEGIISLVALDASLLAVSFLIFPFLWRD